jgi:peptidoglycan/LPS O-acetylase OafA/YrhL
VAPDQNTEESGAAKRDRFALLEPLRGLAALWVFFFHLPRSPEWDRLSPALSGVFGMGHLGVPLFFVISGVVITAAARGAVSRNSGSGAFLLRRLKRIYPPFWASIAVVCAVPFLIEGLSWIKTGTFIRPSSDNLNYQFLSFGFFDWLKIATLARVFDVVPEAPNLQYKFTGVNAVYWTLAIEAQFYLVMAAAVASGKYLYAFVGAVTTASIVVLAFFGWTRTGIFLPYWPMFAVGVGVFVLFERGIRPSRFLGRHATAVACGTIGLITIAVFTWAGRRPLPSQLVIAAVVGLVVLCAEALESTHRRLFASGPGVVRWALRLSAVLGLMSYSVYLLHGRLQFLAYQISRQVIAPGIVQDLAVVVITLMLCYPFYLVFERPFAGQRQSKAAAASEAASPALLSGVTR